MIEFKNISLANCAQLLRVLESHKMKELDFLQSRYIERGSSFEETLHFLERLKLVQVSDGRISMTPDLELGSDRGSGDEGYEHKYRDMIVQRLNLDEDINREVRGLLHRFRLKDGKLRFEPSLERKLADADLRNLLIELDVLDYDIEHDDYIVIDERLICDRILSTPHEMSAESLIRLLDERRLIGEGAECAVLEYERMRLKGYPALIDQLRHIASENVGAGYDIKSFEGPENANPEKDRLIEVKAVSPLNPASFYWTTNEIETARETREIYCLYLVPVRGRTDFCVEQMLVIRDPYTQVYSDGEKWERVPQSYQFKLRK